MFDIHQSSYVNTWSVLQRLLSKGNHVRFDLVNAQPIHLQQTCMKYGNYTTPTLTYHIENRKQSLEDTQYQYNVSHNQAETLIIISIFGENAYTLTREGKITIKEDMYDVKTVTNFHNDLPTLSTNTESTYKFP